MNIVVLSTSPNKDGLTAACAHSAMEGARDAGMDAREIRINDAGIGNCRACNGPGEFGCESSTLLIQSRSPASSSP